MPKTMSASDVAAIRAEMDLAKTGKTARRAMAKAALKHGRLTECGRAEWLREINSK
jgi:hypothetical protein